MARNQAAILAHQRWRRPAPFLDARGDRGDLGIRVGPSIFRVWDQPIDRPALDLVGRPRSLISGGLSRACARALTGDNQLAITGSGWDPELLRLELGEIKLAGFDLSLTGFGDLELKDIMADRNGGPDGPRRRERLQLTDDRRIAPGRHTAAG